MSADLIVKTRKWNTGAEGECRWLGHSSYECGICKAGYFKVRSWTDYDYECPECQATVSIEERVK